MFLFRSDSENAHDFVCLSKLNLNFVFVDEKTVKIEAVDIKFVDSNNDLAGIVIVGTILFEVRFSSDFKAFDLIDFLARVVDELVGLRHSGLAFLRSHECAGAI